MTVLRLFLLVVSLNAAAMGGGGVMLVGLERELVGGGVISPSQFAAGVALGQSTPGPLAAFTTAVGSYALGIPGALAATAGLLAVSLVVVMLLRWVPARWFQLPRVKGALAAVPPFVTALTFFLALQMLLGGAAVHPVLPVLIVVGVALGRLKKVPTPALMVGAVALGMCLQGLW